MMDTIIGLLGVGALFCAYSLGHYQGQKDFRRKARADTLDLRITLLKARAIVQKQADQGNAHAAFALKDINNALKADLKE